MQIVNINLVPSGVNPIVYASQHDNGRVVRFHLMNNSSEWNLDPSDTIRADITRPDGTEISIPMTNNATPYSDLTISYDDLDQEGVYVGEVVITDQYNNVTGSLNFILKVEADPYGDDVTTETASGNPCTFETNLADTLVSLKAAILASGGGGTPSTPIPIVGHSEINLDVNGDTFTVAFGQTVYGGELDVTTGVLTVSHAKIILDGTQTINANAYDGTANNAVARFVLTDEATTGTGAEVPNALCSSLTVVNRGEAGSFAGWKNDAGKINTFTIHENGKYVAIAISEPSVTNNTTLNTWLSNNPITIVYPLATPIEIDVSELSVEAVSGVNNIVSDCGGDVEVTYIKRVE